MTESFSLPIGPLTVFAVLIVVNAFFVAVEFALLASMRGRLDDLVAEKRFGARSAVDLSRRIGVVLAGTQLGITIASLLLGDIAEPAVGSIIEHLIGSKLGEGVRHTVALVIALVIVVFVHTLLGEMVPKNLALARPETLLRLTGAPMRVVIVVFSPIIHGLNRLAAVGARLVGVQPATEQRDAATAAEISVMLTASLDEGLLAPVEHDLLRGTMSVLERTVGSAMVPRDGIVAVPRSASAADIAEVIRSTGRSRVLITGGSLDDIIGFVHVKDLLRLDRQSMRLPLAITTFRATLSVTADEPLSDVLSVMRQQGRHVAVVSAAPLPDATSGSTLGMVTLEDILESIVGDIFDESDDDEPRSPRIGRPR